MQAVLSPTIFFDLRHAAQQRNQGSAGVMGECRNSLFAQSGHILGNAEVLQLVRVELTGYV